MDKPYEKYYQLADLLSEGHYKQALNWLKYEISSRDKIGERFLENKNEDQEYQPSEDMIKKYQEFGIDINNPTKISPYLRHVLAILKFKKLTITMESLRWYTTCLLTKMCQGKTSHQQFDDLEYLLSQVSEGELLKKQRDPRKIRRYDTDDLSIVIGNCILMGQAERLLPQLKYD